MKKLLAILALSSALVVTAACNTVRGAGRDAQSAANAVDNAM
jgi:predicted small secreted protein